MIVEARQKTCDGQRHGMPGMKTQSPIRRSHVSIGDLHTDSYIWNVGENGGLL